MSTISVDVGVCTHCGKVFKEDSEDTFICDECGKVWCSEECAIADGLDINYDGDPFRLGYSCKYCRNEDFKDSELLEFVTSAIGVSRDDLVTFYKRYKEELKNDKACRLDGFISSTFTDKDSGTGKGFVLGGLVGRFEPFHE